MAFPSASVSPLIRTLDLGPTLIQHDIYVVTFQRSHELGDTIQHTTDPQVLLVELMLYEGTEAAGSTRPVTPAQGREVEGCPEVAGGLSGGPVS